MIQGTVLLRFHLPIVFAIASTISVNFTLLNFILSKKFQGKTVYNFEYYQGTEILGIFWMIFFFFDEMIWFKSFYLGG